MKCRSDEEQVIGVSWRWWRFQNDHQAVLVFLEILFLSQELVILKLYDFKEIFKQAIVVLVCIGGQHVVPIVVRIVQYDRRVCRECPYVRR